MVTDAKMQMVFGTKEEMPNSQQGALEAQEETATQTPRSTFKSSADLSVETPRSAEDEESDSESVDGNDEFEHQYYAFLREMAGSMHEATGEDDESEWDSEDEAGEEDGDGLSKPSSNSVPATENLESGPPKLHSLDGSPPSAGGCHFNREANGGRGQNKGEEIEKWTALGDVCCGDGGMSGTTKSAERGSSSTRCGVTSIDSDEGAFDAVEPPESEQRCTWVPSPSHDNRPPVEDDYDVVKAIADFASNQSLSPELLRRERLLEDIRLKESQARSLSSSYPTTQNARAYTKEHRTSDRNVWPTCPA